MFPSHLCLYRSRTILAFFCVYGSVHRESLSIIVQQDATIYIWYSWIRES